MMELAELEALIKKYFDYLVMDFGFLEQSSERVSFSDIIKYANNNFIIEIRYAFRNEFLDAIIYNKKLFLGDNKYKMVGLHHMMIRKIPDFDYEKEYCGIMPKEIGLDESVKRVSQLFKEYSKEILSGKEWYSWEDVMGYEYPDKDAPIKTTIEINYKKKRDSDQDNSRNS